MTWAPRGIFSTTSASVGRSTRKRRPVLPSIDEPSVAPIRSAWATRPEWVWNVAPSRSLTRYRRSLRVDEQDALADAERTFICHSAVRVSDRDRHLVAGA